MAPRVVDKEEKKKKILKAAIEVFSQKGFFRTTIADIAHAAGIGKGTVYEYFRNKETLFIELFAFLIEDHLQYLSGKRESFLTAEQRIENIITETFRYFKQMENIYYIFLDLKIQHLKTSGAPYHQEQFARLYREFRRELAAIIKEGSRKGSFRKVDPDQIATLIIATMEGIMNQWIADHDAFSLEHISSAVRDMIMNFISI